VIGLGRRSAAAVEVVRHSLAFLALVAVLFEMLR
jgi:hypothetical protein